MAEPTAETTPETLTPEAPGKTDVTEESLKKMIQSEVDRVRTSYVKEKKALEAELDALRKEKMSAEQIKDFEKKQLEERLTIKEHELNDREISIKARDLLTSEGLDLSFVDYVKGDTLEATEKRVKSLKVEWQKAIDKAIDDKMKGAGRDPNKGRDGTGTTSEIAGITPAQILAKARADPAWFSKNEAAILAAVGSGQFKK